MEIKTQKHFRNLIISLTEEVIDEEGDYCPPEEDEELDEITVTGDVDGYNTPFAFTGKKGKKKKKKVATNSTGYKTVNEALDKKTNNVKDSYVIQTMRYLELLKELKKSAYKNKKVV